MLFFMCMDFRFLLIAVMEQLVRAMRLHDCRNLIEMVAIGTRQHRQTDTHTHTHYIIRSLYKCLLCHILRSHSHQAFSFSYRWRAAFSVLIVLNSSAYSYYMSSICDPTQTHQIARSTILLWFLPFICNNNVNT